MQPNQPKKNDLPSLRGDMRPESDPAVVTSEKNDGRAALDEALERARAVEADPDPKGKVQAVVTSQVMVPPEKDEDGNQLTGGRIAQRGERVTVSRAFFKRYRGHYVETPEEFERLERKARGEDDF